MLFRSQHIGHNIVRCIMLAASEGLCRDMKVVATGSAIEVPVYGGFRRIGAFHGCGDAIE